jgi:pimeloyl-[acyl-carrier protein] methyl ester esterase
MSAALSVESTGAGSPIVLLHGWALHAGAWGQLVPRLARRHRVHAVDLPGHGHSAPLSPFTLDAIVDLLDAAFPDAPPLTVLGWSLGGQVALRWAWLRPARIASLVLVCTTPRFVAGPDWPHAMTAETLRRFGDELRVAWKLTVQRFLALQVHGSEHGRAALALLRHDLFARGLPSPQMLTEALDLMAIADLRADAPAVAQPALVISGGRDLLTPPGAGRWLASSLLNARFVCIEGAAHAPFLSHPDTFFDAVETFVDGR